MSAPLPSIPCVFMRRGDDKDPAFWPLRRAQNIAAAHYGEGEVVIMAPVEERSLASHNHYFASIKKAWLNLPESLAAEYPTPIHLRQRALIRAGYCTVADYVCTSRAEALRWASNLRKEADDYALVVVAEAVVRVFRPKSQSIKAMGNADFQASKEAVLGVLSEMIGVEVSALNSARAA